MVMGRPRIEFTEEMWKEFESLCEIQCTLIEVASWFRCSEDTIERRVKEKYDTTFAEVFKLKRGVGRISLRRRQFQKAEEGHPTMLIWLGKQYLDQKDKVVNLEPKKEEYIPPASLNPGEQDAISHGERKSQTQPQEIVQKPQKEKEESREG